MSRVTPIVVAVVSMLPLSAHAEYADTTASLRAGALSLAAEFQADVLNDTFMLVNLHEAIGLASGVDLVLRQGLPISGQGFYFGGGIKWTLLTGSSKARRPGIAAYLGGHGRTGGSGGADAAILVDYSFSRVRPYIGLDANLDFGTPDDPAFSLGLYGGVRISLVTNVAWFVEGGLGILGTPRPHFISTGPRVYIW